MFAKGTEITIETHDTIIEGVLERDHGDLDGRIYVRDDVGPVTVNGWMFEGGLQDDGTISLFV